MGREQTADFYDGRMAKVSLPLEQSPWLTVYSLTADLLPLAKEGVPIADLGCGTGRLAKLLYSQGHQRYWGIDFSQERIHEARRYVPDLSFDVGDVFDSGVQRQFPEFGAFVALELLEHIDDDLPLLEALPPHATVLFSVPSYDSAGHVRVFPSADDAARRYEGLLDIDSQAVLPRRKTGKFIFVFRGSRR